MTIVSALTAYLAARAKELSTRAHRLRSDGPGFSILNDWKRLRSSATTNIPTLEREQCPQRLRQSAMIDKGTIFFFKTVQQKMIALSQASDFFQKFPQAPASKNAGSVTKLRTINCAGSGSH